MFLLLKPVEYQTIKRIASWTCDKKNCKHNDGYAVVFKYEVKTPKEVAENTADEIQDSHKRAL